MVICFFSKLAISILYKFQNCIIALQPRLLNLLLEPNPTLMNCKSLHICNGTKIVFTTFHNDGCPQQNLAFAQPHIFCVCHLSMHWKTLNTFKNLIWRTKKTLNPCYSNVKLKIFCFGIMSKLQRHLMVPPFHKSLSLQTM